MPPEVGELVMQLINGLACGPKAGPVYRRTRAHPPTHTQLKWKSWEGELNELFSPLPQTFGVSHTASDRIGDLLYAARARARVIKPVVNRLCRI